MALRTIVASANQKDKPVFLHFETPERENIKSDHVNYDLNKIMQNMGGEAFSYGTFKAAYDTDPRVKNMINNFSEDGAELKTDAESDDIPQGGDEGSDTVSKMAKSATDLSDL